MSITRVRVTVLFSFFQLGGRCYLSVHDPNGSFHLFLLLPFSSLYYFSSSSSICLCFCIYHLHIPRHFAIASPHDHNIPPFVRRISLGYQPTQAHHCRIATDTPVFEHFAVEHHTTTTSLQLILAPHSSSIFINQKPVLWRTKGDQTLAFAPFELLELDGHSQLHTT